MAELTPRDPVKLRPARTRPRKDVIEILEGALERARSGEMRGVVMTAELTGNRINFVASFNDGILLGGHLHMQMALVTNAMTHMSIPAAPEPPNGRDHPLEDEDTPERVEDNLPGSVDFSGGREPE